MMDQNTAVQHLNDMRARIVQARELYALGEHDKAKALEPSNDELREAIAALACARTAATEAKIAKKEQQNALASMNLNDLFKPKDSTGDKPSAE